MIKIAKCKMDTNSVKGQCISYCLAGLVGPFGTLQAGGDRVERRKKCGRYYCVVYKVTFAFDYILFISRRQERSPKGNSAKYYVPHPNPSPFLIKEKGGKVQQ